MKLDIKIINRLDELILTAQKLINERTVSGGNIIRQKTFRGERSIGRTPVSETIDREGVNQWGVSCLNIIKQVFKESSDHYQKFNELFSHFKSVNNLQTVKNALGILKAAKDDYENGYLFDTRTLIEAEVFDDFLEQAEHLLNQGYFTAAAVIAGSVLEDSLRKLCVKNGIALSAKPKLDTINADLAKAGVYNLLKQKQITALADLRNKAAHGQSGFTKEDVEEMIRDVRRFTANYLS
ncbi:MAG: HEPN domain-containing protein [Acidobacteriota bacterium]|nr:HEPN domain-containing protein [Acidobacteriota bacterium]